MYTCTSRKRRNRNVQLVQIGVVSPGAVDAAPAPGETIPPTAPGRCPNGEEVSMEPDDFFGPILQEILDEDRPIAYRQLRILSNPGAADLASFCQAWPAAARKRRREVARAMVRLAEDNLSLNFRDVLLVCLEDRDRVVRLFAIEGLSDDKSRSVLKQLLTLAGRDPSAKVRSRAILALGRFAYRIETTDRLDRYRERLLRLLLDIFSDRSAPLEQRRRALESVSYFSGVDEVEEAIVEAYASPEQKMRISAVHAMGHHMAERWRDAVRHELSSPDPEMRYEAAIASGEMADPELVPHLAPLLGDADHEVARAAIWALGEIGGREARRLLEQALRRPEVDIREAAEDALYTLRFFEDPLAMF